MSVFDFLQLGMWAAALVVGFIGALALAALACWLLLILGLVIHDVWDKWVTR